MVSRAFVRSYIGTEGVTIVIEVTKSAGFRIGVCCSSLKSKPPNNRLKLPARPVTALAFRSARLSQAMVKARAAPVHAAA